MAVLEDREDALLYLQDATLQRVFGNHLPPFPPKYYLAMTTSMADQRREQLEQYLQNVTMDPNVLRSDVFIDFLKLVQLDTFSIATKKASLDLFLPDGRSIKVEVLTSDTAERVLEVVSHKIGLCRELLDHFGLFLIRFCKEGKLSVLKKLADFELPYVSLHSAEVEKCQVGLRKWYLDPSLDASLMDCRAAVDLICMQALKDIENEWAKPTQAQRQKLEALQKEDNKTKFLELAQEVQHYGYMQLDPCTCDYLEPGCGAVLSVGNNEIRCCITLPDNRTQDVIFQMNRVKCWQVTFLGTLLDVDGPQRTLNQNLELRFQYSEDSQWPWFVIYTKQAFLLSSCLKKMISEKTVKLAAENPEMKDRANFLSRKSKIKITKIDSVFGTRKEEDL
ncbi:PREDICTED: sorting nexin-31 [Condylura cristata]|uniref:sorting nexin-31 n=1 Tax=Condylura cristata TaxID=143302 RepID=UPI0003347042|nr:PREDICTED: sorting nexin-31 [Condylura cristata]